MMNRKLIAGLFAVAILPATSFAADAADPKLDRQLPLKNTYQLTCKIGSDGESLQIRMNVRNTSNRVIPKGTPIRVTVRSPFPRFHGTTTTVEAYRDVLPGQTIPLSQPPARARYCMASVTLKSALMERIQKAPR